MMDCEITNSTYRGVGQSRPADRHSLASTTHQVHSDNATDRGRPKTMPATLQSPDTDVGNFTTLETLNSAKGDAQQYIFS